MQTPFRSTKLTFSWQLGIALILLFSFPRFIIVLEANRTGNYSLASVLFVIMVVTPFLLLKKEGRKAIGIRLASNLRWIAGSFVVGVATCAITYFIGNTLYHNSIANWFVYISNSFSGIPGGGLTGETKLFYFVMFAITGMTFSPLGEELLYRGLIHQCFVRKCGNNGASVIDSLVFAIVHLAHFGIIYTEGTWKFLAVPALLWVALMYASGRLFYFCRNKTGSIFGAILSHSGFNLAMTYFIFYHIL